MTTSSAPSERGQTYLDQIGHDLTTLARFTSRNGYDFTIGRTRSDYVVRVLTPPDLLTGGGLAVAEFSTPTLAGTLTAAVAWIDDREAIA